MIVEFKWNKISVKPPLDTSLLIRANAVGPVYDVAVYRGVQPSGEHRWIMADITLDHKAITHWARIEWPEGEVQ